MIEYSVALAFAPFAVLQCIQFFLPTANGRMAFSARLLSIGTLPFSKNVRHTYIPQSVWEQRDEIIKQIQAAMMCNKYNIPTEVNFLNEPEMVEKDYNDK